MGDILKIANYIFTIIFTCEAIIKILALGFDKYSEEFFNIFDMVIVIVSLIEILTEEILTNFTSISLNLSAFRTLRLLRIFKLVKSNESLSLLLESIALTMMKLSTFFVILFILMIQFTLFGMQMFAGNLRLNKDGTCNLNKFGFPYDN
jgi:hypothetical protein